MLVKLRRGTGGTGGGEGTGAGTGQGKKMVKPAAAPGTGSGSSGSGSGQVREGSGVPVTPPYLVSSTILVGPPAARNRETIEGTTA